MIYNEKRLSTTSMNNPNKKQKLVKSKKNGARGSLQVVSKSAPVAQTQSGQRGLPVIKNIPGGISVAFCEKVLQLKQPINAESRVAISVNPLSMPWLAGIAIGYQQFRIKKFAAKFLTRTATSSVGRITMAPYYEATNPLKNYDSGGVNGIFDFVASLPGVKEFALWTTEQVGFLASRTLRNVYRTVGILQAFPEGIAAQAGNGSPEDESVTPGYMLVHYESNGVALDAGDLWIEYEYEFLSPQLLYPSGVAVSSDSTTSSALALTTEPRLVGYGLSPSATNKLECLSPGYWTVIILQTGTSIVMDVDGHTVANWAGSDVTARCIVKSLSRSTLSFGGAVDSDDQNLHAGSGGTEQMQVLFLKLDYGDVLSIDALTSGTLATTRVHAFRGCPPAAIL